MVKRAIDGFVPRNTPARRAPVDSQKKPAVNFGDMGHTVSVRHQQQLPPRPITSAPNRGVRSDIDESLREISNNLDLSPSKHSGKGAPKNGQKKRDWKKIAKRAAIAITVIVLGIGIFLGVRALMAGNAVFKGDIFGFVQKKPLKQDAHGRSNILILGTRATRTHKVSSARPLRIPKHAAAHPIPKPGPVHANTSTMKPSTTPVSAPVVRKVDPPSPCPTPPVISRSKISPISLTSLDQRSAIGEHGIPTSPAQSTSQQLADRCSEFLKSCLGFMKKVCSVMAKATN